MKTNKIKCFIVLIGYTVLYTFVYYISQIELNKHCGGFICFNFNKDIVYLYHAVYIIITFTLSFILFKRAKYRLYIFLLGIVLAALIFLSWEKKTYGDYKKEAIFFIQKRINTIEREKSNALATYNIETLGEPNITSEEVPSNGFVYIRLNVPFVKISGEIDGRSLLYHYKIVKNPTIISPSGMMCVIDPDINNNWLTLNNTSTHNFVQRMHINPGDPNIILNKDNFNQYYLEHMVYLENPVGQDNAHDCLLPKVYRQIKSEDFTIQKLTPEELTELFDSKIRDIKDQSSVLTFKQHLKNKYL